MGVDDKKLGNVFVGANEQKCPDPIFDLQTTFSSILNTISLRYTGFRENSTKILERDKSLILMGIQKYERMY